MRVGLATTAVVPLVGETLRRFANDRPGIHLAVSNHGMIDPSAGLRAARVDVGFVRPPFSDAGELAMETVLTEPRYIVLRAGHPLAGGESLRPQDVVGEPWIYEARTRRRARSGRLRSSATSLCGRAPV